MRRTSSYLPAAFAAAAALAWGCGPDVAPTAPPNLNIGSGGAFVEICKIGPAGSWADFTVTATHDTVLLPSFRLNALPDMCSNGVNVATVWVALNQSDPNSQVTVTETGATPGVSVDQIRAVDMNGLQVIYGPTNAVTVTTNFTNGAIAYFKNLGQQGEGCTPGYWKQDQHFGNWTAPYTPSTLFGSVFSNAFPGKTLLQVLWLQGGGLNALGRHAVAALLDAASPAVDYDLSVAQVISMFNAAYASGNYEATKNIFATFNEQGCPLALAR